MKKVFSVDVSKIDIEEANNKDFMKLKIYAISDKVNRNNSEFLYEGFEASIPTMYNKPILAYYNEELGDTEEHNSKLNIDEEGVYSDYQYDKGERPVGVIPESADIHIETIDDKNWIVIDGCVIWTEYNRQLYKLIKKQLKKKVSVEVEVLDYYKEDGIDKFKAWKFLGITILGKNPEDGSVVEEGIEGAHLQLDDFVDSPKFNKYMSKLSFALKKEFLDNNIEQKRVESMKTYNDLRRAISAYLDKFTVTDEDCDCAYYRYYVEDIMLDDSKAIIYDTSEGKYYRISFEIVEDDVVIDMENKVELELAFVEKYSSCEHEKRFLNIKENMAPSVSEKEEKMDKFIKSAEEAGFVCLGLLNGKLKFAKKFSIEGDEIVEIEKIDIFSIEQDKCEEDFVEENLVLDVEEEAKDDNKAEEEKCEDSENEACDEAEGNKVTEALDDEEAEKAEDVENTENAENVEETKTEEQERIVELEAQNNSLLTELEAVKAELKEIKNENFVKETDAILESEKDLDDEDKNALVEMRNEFKFDTVEDFVKELCYRQYVKKDKKEESKKLDFSTNKSSVVVEHKAKTIKERLQEI